MTPSSMILTIGGKYVDPLNLHPMDINIHDIAHALSNICRFTGHVRKFYSVAEHSVRVARLLPPRLEMWGLLHDASEAYVCDVSYPLKRQSQFEGYREIESRIMETVAKMYDLEWPEPPQVKWADREACKQEGSVLVPGWTLKPDVAWFDPVIGLSPSQAKKIFLQKFDEIRRRPQVK